MSLRPQMSQRMQKRQNARNRSRRNKRVGKVKIPGDLCPFPPRMRRSFRYTNNLYLQEPAVGNGSVNAYRMNDLYDPDFTGVGAQPMYFDQLCTSTGPYQKFRVFGATIKMKVLNISSNPAVVGVFPTPYTAVNAFSSLKAFSEKPFAVHSLLASSAAGGCKTEIVRKYTVAQVGGLSPKHVAYDEYFSGAYNATPTQQVYFTIWACASSGAGAAVTVTVDLEVIYDAELYSLYGTSTS